MMLIRDLRQLLARIPESEDNAPVLIDGSILEDWELNARVFHTHTVSGSLAYIHPITIGAQKETDFYPSIRNVLWLKPRNAELKTIAIAPELTKGGMV